jgi:hypothetical protein
MANYTTRTDFILTMKLLEKAISTYSASNVKDAKALTDRKSGKHNLQGHARAVIPLAVWLAFQEPSILQPIRRRTTLSSGMTAHSSEARDSRSWSPVKKALKKHLALAGGDVVAPSAKSNSPDTPAKIAATYLGNDYGGGQTTGGAGNTVLKRALKLLAHTIPV